MICHGQACIRGTRVPVAVIVDSLADGERPDAIAVAYRIEPADIRAALEYVPATRRPEL